MCSRSACRKATSIEDFYSIMKKPKKISIKHPQGILVTEPLMVQFISGNKKYCMVYIASNSESKSIRLSD